MVESGASSSTPAPKEPEQKRSTVTIGVDPLTGGLNPHLAANNSELVRKVADLVLPSAFHGGVMDTDVLKSAAEVPAPEGVAQRVRYVISQPAQWSDGTPITGADFEYLWRSMVDTPGTLGSSGYRAIRDVKTSKDGRIVTVDFDHYVADWRILFSHLLPSHLVKEKNFATALSAGIPASAGTFLVDSVDHGRGIITLNRNDRFWGESPARFDVLQLRFIRSSTQMVDMIRSGQIEAADITPGETTVESLQLIPDIATRVHTRPRQLRLRLNANELDSSAARRDLASVIDTGQLARLATGRTSHLQAAEGGRAVYGERDLNALRQESAERPIRIAADPTDAVAGAAARTLVDVLTNYGIKAQVVEERLSTIIGRFVPAGDVDAYFAWDTTFTTSFTAGDRFECALDSDATTCPAESAGDLWDVLSRAVSPQEAAARADEYNREATLWVPILDETRLQVGELAEETTKEEPGGEDPAGAGSEESS